MIPTAVAAVGTIYYVYAERQHQFESGLGEATRALAFVVEREIASREGIVRTLSLSPTLDREDLQPFYEYARGIAPTEQTVVVLTDLDGQQIVNTRRPFGSPSLPHIALTPAQLQQARAGTVVSDVYYASIGRHYSFAVVVPVVRGGQVKYLLAYAGYASRLQKVFEDQKLPASWIAAVLDRKGVVVARNREAEKYVGQAVGDRLRGQIGEARAGLLESTALDGTRILASFSTAPAYGWTFVIGVPTSQIRSPAAAASGFALLSAALLFLALWAASRLGRGLVEPVLQVEEAAERIARAETVEVRETGLVETDKVLQVLSTTSHAVQRASADMKARVEEALAEADKAHQVALQSQRLEALGQLTGGVAHDFNNLLMVVSNYAYLLRARDPRLADNAEIAGIQRAVAAGAKLTRQLLAFARRQPVRPEPVRLQERLPELVSLLKASLGAKVTVTCEVAEDTFPVRVDPAEFELALINLAVNARDAMPDGGKLRVSAGNRDDGTVQVTVADTGKGIPPEVLPRVFEPFFTTKPVGHGTGLGLSQVFGFAQQAGGAARIESSTGAGTTIVLVLPALRHDQAAERGGNGEASDGAVAVARGTVLLVEDNKELAAVTALVLREAGYVIVQAESGDAARALLEQRAAIDVVLSDVRMPGEMDGIALAQWLRRNRADLPVILMTGYTEELEQARQLGLEVLPKPSPPKALLDALGRELAITRSAGRPGAA
ncbi:MAG: putative histidine kinase, hybrid [Ramlibacter sp.]|nr:putative histidine kinase, hybrid [Ramlibacter sp.]